MFPSPRPSSKTRPPRARRCPLAPRDLIALLRSLETLWEVTPEGRIRSHCDNTLRHTREFLKSRSLPEGRAVAWLEAHGGFCDCEVLLNVAP